VAEVPVSNVAMSARPGADPASSLYDVTPAGGDVQLSPTELPETVAERLSGASGIAAAETLAEFADTAPLGQLAERPNDVFTMHSHETVVDIGRPPVPVTGASTGDGRAGRDELSHVLDQTADTMTSTLTRQRRNDCSM